MSKTSLAGVVNESLSDKALLINVTGAKAGVDGRARRTVALMDSLTEWHSFPQTYVTVANGLHEH
jgi:hypothetical protein